MLLESVFSLLYGRGCWYTSSVQNFQKNTSEEETETTDASTCNLTWLSDIKQHQNHVTLWNKMSTNEEVMTVKLWGVDRLHLHFDYHSEYNSVFFQLFFFKMYLFLYFLFMKHPHSSVLKKNAWSYNKMFLFTSRYPVLSFDVLYVQIFI